MRDIIIMSDILMIVFCESAEVHYAIAYVLFPDAKVMFE